MIQILELKADKSEVKEPFYADLLIKNPDLISNDLSVIQKEYPIPFNGGRVDLAFSRKSELHLVEIKVCSLATKDEVLKHALPQINRYKSNMEKFLSVFKLSIKISAIIVLFILDGTKNRKYVKDEKGVKLLHYHERDIPSSIIALKRTIYGLERNKKTLKQQVAKVKRETTRLEKQYGILWKKVENLRGMPLNLLFEQLKDTQELISVKVKGKNINKVDSLLSKTAAPFMMQSRQGVYSDPKLNRNRTAYFYFPQKTKASIIKAIENLGKLSYLSTRNVVSSDLKKE